MKHKFQKANNEIIKTTIQQLKTTNNNNFTNKIVLVQMETRML